MNEDFDEEDTVKYNFARMKPFFYSYGRYVMYKHIMELKKNNIKIFRVFCDSFTCSKNEYMDKLIGPELGKLKLESKEWNHNCGKFASLKVWKKLE